MKIGVDAGALSVSDERLKAGLYYVNRNLIIQLSELDNNNYYQLYTFRSLDKDLLDKLSINMANQVIYPQIGWYSCRLPLELFLRPVDIFLGLSQAVPYNSAQFNIGFIYDLAFLRYPKGYPDSLSKLMSLTNETVTRSQRIITISNSTKKEILNNFMIDEAKISVSYLGIDDIFTLTTEKINHKYPYFLFVGSLKIIKNIPRLIEAFDILLRKVKKRFELIIIGGDYWMDDEIPKKIRDLKLEDYIKFLGFINRNDLPKYYRGAIALVTPSFWEGFCLPVVEAMACGCPVIASRNGALPEVIGNSGIYFDPYNVEELALAMKRLSVNSSLRANMITTGLKRAKIFSWRKFAQSVYDIIKHKN